MRVMEMGDGWGQRGDGDGVLEDDGADGAAGDGSG